MAQLEARYHLNEPFLTRYWIWLTSALHGDLGESIPLHEQVSTLIGQRIGVTLGLVLYAAAIIVFVGVGLGIIGALGRGAVDTGVLLTSTVSAALPAVRGCGPCCSSCLASGWAGSRCSATGQRVSRLGRPSHLAGCGPGGDVGRPRRPA